jgi:hypothetical protein
MPPIRARARAAADRNEALRKISLSGHGLPKKSFFSRRAARLRNGMLRDCRSWARDST